MSYTKFPIACWQDAQQTFYARTVSGSDVSAADADQKKCLEQIRAALIWMSENRYVERPEFETPQIETLTIPVRTAEQAQGQRWPAKEMSYLQLPCIWGKRDDDSVACSLPTLKIVFSCDDEKSFREIAIEEAQAKLNGLPQSAIAAMLPAGQMQVDTLNVALGEYKDREHHLRFQALETIANPLTGKAAKKQFNQPWCRDDEVRRLVNLFSQTDGNLLLVGPRGVGKSTILMWAARELLQKRREVARKEEETKRKVPVACPVWSTSAQRVVAGMQYLGQWEQRLEAVIAELAEFQGVLCFDRLGLLLKAGGGDSSSSIASFIAPFLQNRELRVVIEATREELDQCRVELPGFENLFQLFEVEPMSEEQSWTVLNHLGQNYQRNHQVKFAEDSVPLCTRLFRRFMPYDSFPGKSVGFWKSLFEKARRKHRKTVSADDLVSSFTDLTGLPESLIRDQVGLPVAEIRQWFEQRIIGQPEACQSLTNVITTFKAGLNDPQKPIGVMLFCGPTGVGKTETVKALTQFMFGNAASEQTESGSRTLIQDRLVRLDMSEYAGLGAGQKLIMQPDGQPSQWIKRLRQQPFSIVLLDEVEKASAEVFDVLMGVFDEGRLTDRWGRVTDFRSSIIIMTSNLGVTSKDPVGFNSDSDQGFESSVRKFFRPEFFNRIDKIVPFSSLDEKSIAQIAEMELQRIAQRDGVQSRKIALTWDREVVDFLVQRGFSNKLGARPLQRAIERHVSVPLSRRIAEHPDLEECTLSFVLTNDQIVVQ